MIYFDIKKSLRAFKTSFRKFIFYHSVYQSQNIVISVV